MILEILSFLSGMASLSSGCLPGDSAIVASTVVAAWTVGMILNVQGGESADVALPEDCGSHDKESRLECVEQFLQKEQKV